MRTFYALPLVLAVGAVVLAQDDKAFDHDDVASPQASFKTFMNAVLNDGGKLSDEQRSKVFDEYFDFDAWATHTAEVDHREMTPAELRQARDEWRTVFKSKELADSYRKRDVTVLQTPDPDWESGRAEIVISMKNAVSGRVEKFRVLMSLDVANLHWRWYAMPPIADTAKTPLPPPEVKTPTQRLLEIRQELADLAKARRALDILERRLNAERRRLLADIQENRAGEGPYASPRTTVENSWKAIQAANFNSFLRGHLKSRRKKADTPETRRRFARNTERIQSWKVLESTIDEKDTSRSTVRVQLTYQAQGEQAPRLRTLSISLRKVADEWLIDEEP